VILGGRSPSLVGLAFARHIGHDALVPPTIDDRCDWCYGPLAESDLQSVLGQALGQIEAAACAGCVAARVVLRPPDSLNESDVSLSGEDAWALAVAGGLCDADNDSIQRSTYVLRRVAGYE
jgi:hypothetical protein